MATRTGKSAAQRLGKRVRGGEPIRLRAAFGDAGSYYELDVVGRVGNPRPQMSLHVTWCGKRVVEELVAGKTEAMRAAAAENAFPVVHRSQHASFGLALKRFAKCVRTGELPEITELTPRFESIVITEGSDDLLAEAVLAFAETFDVEAPTELDALRAQWSELRTRTMDALAPALERARVEAIEASERADRERAEATQKRLEEEMAKRRGDHLCIDTSKMPDRGGPRFNEEALLAKHTDVAKLLFMGDQLGSWMYWLEQARPVALTSLIIDTYWETLTRSAAYPVGDISPVLAACSNLKFVHLVGGLMVMQPIVSARLETLTLLSDPLDAASARVIFESPAPALKRLTLGLRYERGSCADEALAAAIHDDTLPALSELTIAYADEPALILRQLIQSGVLARLEVLRFLLDDEVRIDECAKLVSTHHEAFAHLDELGLGSDRMGMSPEVHDELKAQVTGLTTCDDPFDSSRYDLKAFVE